MPLAPGDRLGPYEVIAPLGAGGMGEVYRARDTRLKRDVALKILPAALTTDAERLARFQREAQVLASISHPNIGHLYGFEDSGTTQALVLELIPGLTLAELIAQGPIAVADARAMAAQIAAKSPIAVRLAKEAMWRIDGLPLMQAYRIEQDYTARLSHFEDASEARRARAEGRDPSWRFR